MEALYDAKTFTVSGNRSDGHTQTMEKAEIRSERSAAVRWQVVGNGPVSTFLRRVLAESSLASSPGGEPVDRTVAVLVADDGDFAAITGQRPEARRSRIVRDIHEALSPTTPVGTPDVLADEGRETTDEPDRIGSRTVRSDQLSRVIVISSAVVYGAFASRETIVDSDPVLTAHELGIAGDVALYESSVRDVLDSLGDAAPPLTVVRCASLVGPDVDTMITRHFESPRLLAVREVDRAWQFLHLEDLVTAVRLIVEQEIDGSVTAGAMRATADGSVLPDVEATETVARIASRRIIELRSSAAFATAERLHRAGVLTAPASDLAYAVYPWTVQSSTLVEYGWRSQVTTAECARQIADQVRGQVGMGGRRFRSTGAAALGAAGAAVALVGTAALVRQSNRHR